MSATTTHTLACRPGFLTRLATRAILLGVGLLLGVLAAVLPAGQPRASAETGAARSAARPASKQSPVLRRARTHTAVARRGRATGRRTVPAGSCAQNLRRLAAAMRLYLQDSDDCLPPANRWGEALRPYVKTVAAWHCPQRRGGKGTSYAMNRRLGGQSIHDEALWGCVLLFESSSGKENAADEGTSLCSPGRHDGGNYYLLCNGRIVRSKERQRFVPGATGKR